MRLSDSIVLEQITSQHLSGTPRKQPFLIQGHVTDLICSMYEQILHLFSKNNVLPKSWKLHPPKPILDLDRLNLVANNAAIMLNKLL